MNWDAQGWRQYARSTEKELENVFAANKEWEKWAADLEKKHEEELT